MQQNQSHRTWKQIKVEIHHRLKPVSGIMQRNLLCRHSRKRRAGPLGFCPCFTPIHLGFITHSFPLFDIVLFQTISFKLWLEESSDHQKHDSNDYQIHPIPLEESFYIHTLKLFKSKIRTLIILSLLYFQIIIFSGFTPHF
ncbi:hypothetical protein D3C80_1674830 [compost metagenome]